MTRDLSRALECEFPCVYRILVGVYIGGRLRNRTDKN